MAEVVAVVAVVAAVGEEDVAAVVVGNVDKAATSVETKCG